ncbi:hypothetical protein B0H17DRAFT_1340464 [Mycena rosella]|uniref:Uncharacterized protein n=1 Tax=Mycena rosella TaxID=1033263 RepID=A0AAD7FHB0_MYCRO|nr:hypothetical protein B0H17DRAFT_1340464 [Mycena rosella]
MPIFYKLPLKELWLRRRNKITASGDDATGAGDDTGASRLDDESGTSLRDSNFESLHPAQTAHPISRERKLPKRFALKSTRALRIFSLVLHSTLIAIHAGLAVAWVIESDHGLVVLVEHETIIALLITASTTAFGTTYLLGAAGICDADSR